jgi:hypothetical protein
MFSINKERVMKKMLFVSAIFIALISGRAIAQDSATADATVVIQAAISITQVQDLDFGMVAPGDAAATVAPADATAAVFNVNGEANASYDIILPASVAMTGPGADIVVGSFTSNPAAGSNGLLDGTGTQELRVGAQRPTIPLAQVSGSYAGTFTVEVAY